MREGKRVRLEVGRLDALIMHKEPNDNILWFRRTGPLEYTVLSKEELVSLNSWLEKNPDFARNVRDLTLAQVDEAIKPLAISIMTRTEEE